MTLLVIGAVVAFVLAQACFFYGTILWSRMVFEVNAKLPPERQIGLYWWYVGKYGRLMREYRRLYPEGRHLRSVYRVGAAGFGLFLISIALFLMISPERSP
jgi:hypothetical protein